MEDDPTVSEMRRGTKSRSRLAAPFMAAGELVNLRTTILRVTQSRLCEQLINPATGEPCSDSILSLWEKGKRPIPLWAARRVRGLAEAAKSYDARVIE